MGVFGDLFRQSGSMGKPANDAKDGFEYGQKTMYPTKVHERAVPTQGPVVEVTRGPVKAEQAGVPDKWEEILTETRRPESIRVREQVQANPFCQGRKFQTVMVTSEWAGVENELFKLAQSMKKHDLYMGAVTDSNLQRVIDYIDQYFGEAGIVGAVNVVKKQGKCPELQFSAHVPGFGMAGCATHEITWGIKCAHPTWMVSAYGDNLANTWWPKISLAQSNQVRGLAQEVFQRSQEVGQLLQIVPTTLKQLEAAQVVGTSVPMLRTLAEYYTGICGANVAVYRTAGLLEAGKVIRRIDGLESYYIDITVPVGLRAPGQDAEDTLRTIIAAGPGSTHGFPTKTYVPAKVTLTLMFGKDGKLVEVSRSYVEIRHYEAEFKSGYVEDPALSRTLIRMRAVG